MFDKFGFTGVVSASVSNFCMAESDEKLGHDEGAPDIRLKPPTRLEVVWRSDGERSPFVSVEEGSEPMSPLPEHLFEDPFGVKTLDGLRDSVKAGLALAGTIEEDAYLLHNLRSYRAASECGQHIAENLPLLGGKRFPRLVYPASARDLSVLGLAEQLLEHAEIDGVNIVLTEAYEEQNRESHTKRFLQFLKRYAEIRGEEFAVTETDQYNFVLTVKGKPVEIELKIHEKDDPVASEEELGKADIVFFHDLDGAYERAGTLRKILTTVQLGMKARSAGAGVGSGCRVPLLVVDDLPRDIWKWFGNVDFKSTAAYGHRGPRALTADPDRNSVEFGGSFQRGLVVKVHPELLGLSEEAFLRYLSFAFYAYLVSQEPESYGEHARQSLAEKTELNRMSASVDGADDMKAFAEIAELPQEVLSNKRLASMILPFLRRMEHLMTARLEESQQPLAYPWLDREDGSAKTRPPLSKRLRDAYEQRHAAVRGAIQQAEILLLDFLGANTAVRNLKHHFQLRLTDTVGFTIPNWPKSLLELLDDEIFVLFLRTLLTGIHGVIDPSVQDKNPPIFPPAVIGGLANINTALQKRGMGTLDDKIKEILLMAHFAHRRKKLEKEIHLFDEAPGLMAALNAAKQAFRERLKGLVPKL